MRAFAEPARRASGSAPPAFIIRPAASSLPVSRSADRDEAQARGMADRVLRDDAPLDTLLRRVPANTAGSASGRPLDEPTRAYFEPRFGFDFSSVRIHADAQGDQAARSVNARAFTLGRDLFFREGEFNPATAPGRQLLAHELAHVTQPGPPTIRREPGKNAQESWNAVVGQVSVQPANDAAKKALADETIRRFLATTEGAFVINDLWWLFCGKIGEQCRSTVFVVFLDELGEGFDAGGSGGFSPDIPDQPLYHAFVEYAATTAIADVESQMATTLHHELTHIWFIHAHRELATTLYKTGHHDASLPEGTHDLFKERLDAFANHIHGLEDEIHAEAEARRKVAQQPFLEEPIEEAAEPARPEPAAPRRFGAQVFAQGGVVSLGPTRGTVIAGADVILERIAALRVGARGVYLSPGHLLAGGAVGFRKLQGERSGPFGGRVENPLFFDIEAGILAELSSGDAERLTNRAAATGALSIGQERGQSGSRLYWQVGAFVVITDRIDAGIGVTGGAGGRF